MGKYDTTATDQWLKDKLQPQWREEAAQTEWGGAVGEAIRILRSHKIGTTVGNYETHCTYKGVRASSVRVGNKVLVFVGSTTKLSVYTPYEFESKLIINYLGSDEPVAWLEGCSYNVKTKHIDCVEDLLSSVVQIIVKVGGIYLHG